MTKNKLKNELEETYCAYCEEIDGIYTFEKGFDAKSTMPIFHPVTWDRAEGKRIEIITVKEVNRRREENKKIKKLQDKEKAILNELENIQVNISMTAIKRLNIVQNIIKDLNSLQDEYNLISPWFPLYDEIEKAKLIESTIESLLDNNDTGKEKIKSIENKNYWKDITGEEKYKIYNSLLNKNYIDSLEEGKPVITMENAILLFKALHDLRLIDESLINYKSITKKEYWKSDFIISEFIRQEKRKDGTDFNKNNIRDNKKNLYTDIDNSLKIEKIKSIIQSALTA